MFQKYPNKYFFGSSLFCVDKKKDFQQVRGPVFTTKFRRKDKRCMEIQETTGTGEEMGMGVF